MTGVRLPRSRRVWTHLAVSGFFLCSLPFTLFPLGEERVTSALAGIGNATTPLATVLFTLILIPADRLSSRKLVAVVLGFLGVIVTGWWLLHRDIMRAPWSTLPGSGSPLWPVVAILTLGIVGTGVAFSFHFDIVRAVGPTVGATVTYVIPVVAVVLGIVFVHERLQWPQVAGAAIVLAAAVVTGLPDRRPRADSALPLGESDPEVEASRPG